MTVWISIVAFFVDSDKIENENIYFNMVTHKLLIENYNSSIDSK